MMTRRSFFLLIWIKDVGFTPCCFSSMESSYYSLIRNTEDGQYVGWVPDLPGVMASGVSEAEIMYRLSRDAREIRDKIVAKGLPLPKPSTADELPLGDRRGRYRRLLLDLG